MFLSLWRRLRNRNPGLSRRKCLRGGQRPSYRPQFDPLEDRVLPALPVVGVHVIAAVPGVITGLRHLGGKPAGGTSSIQVTVNENSPETVIHLGNVFGAMRGIQYAHGLQLSMLGNNNPGLVTTDLSDMDLTLTYAAGKHGKATITVGATDANDVFVKVTILVTVRPWKPAITASSNVSTTAGPSR
jgi:hypothetical protein